MTGAKLEEKTEIKISPIKLYDVVFFNDDYTTVDFVISLLMGIFNYSEADATALTMKVSNEGLAIVATHVYEIADEKKSLCLVNAAHYGHPLKVEIAESSSDA